MRCQFSPFREHHTRTCGMGRSTYMIINVPSSIHHTPFQDEQHPSPSLAIPRNHPLAMPLPHLLPTPDRQALDGFDSIVDRHRRDQPIGLGDVHARLGLEDRGFGSTRDGGDEGGVLVEKVDGPFRWVPVATPLAWSLDGVR